ncbi:hypothetical protein Pcinc_006725 [Petrolisthes cinctipes]|uniref:Nondiscriminating glutamyl-tRNA synthetase EARS2, mitochondrial n=1 Tax=Petrolisthes cinctipes TaxID=88211 RepID=A0AAE1KYR9_PETCI|nr:hypothetical protein Pcinc_006725 [Petrolisthes cinctipes]
MATQGGSMKLTITPEGFLEMKETPAKSLKPITSPVEASLKLMKTSDGFLTPITIPEDSQRLTKAPDGSLKPILMTGEAGPRLTIASDGYLKTGEAGPRLTKASDGSLKPILMTREADPRLTKASDGSLKTGEAGPRLTKASDGSLKPIIISTPKGSLKRINTTPHEESLKKIMTSTTRGSQRLMTTSGGSLKLVKPSEESIKQIGIATQEGSPKLLSTLEGSLKMLIKITPKESTKLMKTSEGFLKPASALEEGLVKLMKTPDGSLKAVSMCQTNRSQKQIMKTTERSCDTDPNRITESSNDNPSKISPMHPYKPCKRTGINTTENPSQIPQTHYNLRVRKEKSNNENPSHITKIECKNSNRINSNPKAIAKTDSIDSLGKIPQADDNNASRVPKTCSDSNPSAVPEIYENPSMIPKADNNSSRIPKIWPVPSRTPEANNSLGGIPKTDSDDCKVKSFIPVCGIGEGFTESLERNMMGFILVSRFGRTCFPHINRLQPTRRNLLISSQKYDEVRVRFAPSPTGHLHLGGLRTALYNYLFAKSNNGKFILRMEDTDQSRLVPGVSDMLEEMLRWANIPPDESPRLGGSTGPYVQSQRLPLYQSTVTKLLESGAAYKCFCSSRRLAWLRNAAVQQNETPKYDNRCRNLSPAKVEKLESEGTPYCIRFKLEPIDAPLQDLIYGPVLHNTAELEGDPVIFKTDGFPTYHLANVVDDYHMGITHVLRGVEWQISTTKHILLYKALGWEAPQFGHLPLILNKDGSKLSKRQGDVYVDYYRSQGYSPLALLNFITSIGGGFTDREHNALLSTDELIEKFSLSHLTKNSCRLDTEKLHQYNRINLERDIRNPTKLPSLVTQLHSLLKTKYGERLTPGVAEGGMGKEYIGKVLEWSEGRIITLHDMLLQSFSYLWVVPQELPLDSLPSIPCPHAVVLESMQEVFISNQNNFTKDEIVKTIKDIGRRLGVKMPAIMKLVRMTISGLKEGPPVGEMLEVLGREEVLRRITHALHLLHKHFSLQTGRES